MTEGNYVRNLAGGGVVAAHGRRSQAPPPPMGTVAWLCGRDGFAACSLVVAVNQQFRT